MYQVGDRVMIKSIDNQFIETVTKVKGELVLTDSGKKFQNNSSIENFSNKRARSYSQYVIISKI